MTTPFPWLAAYGLALDIVGAAWIAKALAFSSTRDLMDYSAARWDISPAILASLEQQRLDSRCGLAVLLSGFVMQLAGLFVSGVTAWVPGLLAALILILAAVYYKLAKKKQEASRSDRVTEYVLKGGQLP